MHFPLSNQQHKPLLAKLMNFIKKIDTTIILSSMIAVCLCCITFVTLAVPYQPKKNEVVANWQQFTPDKENQSLVERIEWHLIQGQRPGIQNLHHAKAEMLLPLLFEEHGESFDYLYLKARIVQHQHQFDYANELLDSLLTKAPKHAGGWLLKANILLIQSKHQAAEEACKQLFGLTDLLLATSCLLEVQSHKEELLTSSYQKMQMIIERYAVQQSTSPTAEDQNFLWMIQVTADMAMRSGSPKQALMHLSRFELADMPLSYITLWADAQIMSGNHQQVLSVLTPIVMSQPFKDDALLVRLAIAEKALENPRSVDQMPLRWKLQIAERVKVRLARNDAFHAADIAKFFIYIDPKPKQALHWARVNYQQAKMPDDKALLEEAQQLNQNDVKGA